MFEKLRKILTRSQNEERNRTTVVGAKERSSAEAGQPYVLISRRFSDADLTIEGFPELYYCTGCRDYFVLAWHDEGSPLAAEFDVILRSSVLPKSGDASLPTNVFCPKCKVEYPVYGPIHQPDSTDYRPASVEVYEEFEFPFPPDVPSDASGRIKVASFVINKAVLIVTGEFPPQFDVADFAYSGLIKFVFPRFSGEGFVVTQQGGIRLHVLRTNIVLDETSWLTNLLNEHVCPNEQVKAKLFITPGIVRLNPPLEQGLYCLVLDA